MAEPSTSGILANNSAGLHALLAGVFGVLVGDIIMVVISAMAGCYLSLSGTDVTSWKKALNRMVLSVLLSLVLSWAIAEVLINMYPSLKSFYLNSLISFVIGLLSDKMFLVKELVWQFVVARASQLFKTTTPSPNISKDDN